MARIWIEAYGCSASYADSEAIAGILAGGGHSMAGSAEEADLSLVVTCSVKDATAGRMMHRVRKLGSRPLVVAGCMAKAEPQTVSRSAGSASLMGPGAVSRALEVVNSALEGRRTVALEDTGAEKTALPRLRLNRSVGIVEIASGCMSECTFCQTKLAKGGLRSYRPGRIAEQVERDVRDGCREIWLTSTDNGCYGLDIGTDLPELVERVRAVPGEFMIRVGMMNPMYMPRIRERLLEAMDHPKVYKFLHVPVQSGSDRVLREMARGHTAGAFRKAASEARKRFERFTLSTDIIAGFPSETDAEFRQTLDLIRETRPDIVNLSKYSRRPGTEAAGREQVPHAAISERSRMAAAEAERISLESNRAWVGWRGPVLFAGQKGRTPAYRPVLAEGAPEGTHTVEITGASAHGLAGRLCREN